MKPEVKRLTEFDKELLNDIYEKIDYPNQKFNPLFFQNIKNVFLVSYINEQPTGFLYAYILDFPDEEYPEMFLYSLDTIEEFRQRGVATSLLENLKEIAKSAGCKEMFVPTNKSNKAAMSLYLKTGGDPEFNDDQIFVYKLD